MVFSSTVFLFLFLPIVLVLYLLVPGTQGRNLLLLAASLFFYAWGESIFVGVMLLSIALNYALGLLLEIPSNKPSDRRAILVIAIALNLGLLAYFKYGNFFVANFNRLVIHLAGLPIAPAPIEIAPIHLPIGISFFTFQALSYIIDVYRQKIAAGKNLLNVALYIAFFPQLIAGPIVRYRDIEAGLQKRAITVENFASGVRRFILGLGKKMLIANTLAEPADAIFALPPGELTAGLAWLGISCYTLQIYFDFSGYSDMAIALGKMFGFQFPENFNYPYISRSIREFWRRWHISLSTWFRDYLYIPLGGNRYSSLRTSLNLGTVFVLCGLWHGASWTFIIWGLFHGFFIAIERLLPPTGLAEKKFWPLQHCYLLLVVMVGWIFFRAETLADAIAFLQAAVGLGSESFGSESFGSEYQMTAYFNSEILVTMVVGAIASLPVLPMLRKSYQQWTATWLGRSVLGAIAISGIELSALTLIFLACAAKLAAGTYNPFIYFRF
ncbi:MAG: MBOAT family protein [Oscillatoria sp. SIO1A7]|nr:MBOAT family protein [Oscillatoria sp. SIO1A7]